jgi:endogenous inhibitor of DNA gyrase (YacG/DUF329 family)
MRRGHSGRVDKNQTEIVPRLDRRGKVITERRLAAAIRNAAHASALALARSAAKPVWACATCGVEKPGTVHQNRHRYCSKQCMAADYRVRMCGSANPNHRDGGWRICEHCRRPYVHYSKTRRFCSLACSYASDLCMRGRAKKDANHAEIVTALQKAGASILDTSAIGRGMPDLVVGYQGACVLMEIKNPKNSYGKSGLSRLQMEWSSSWRGGPVHVVRSVEDALEAIGAVTRTA